MSFFGGIAERSRANDPYAPAPSAPQPFSYPQPSYTWDAAQSWGLGQALNVGQVQAGPQFALNQNTREQLASQLGLANANQSQQSGYLRDDYNQSLAQNDLSQQSLSLQRGANQRQSPYLDTLHQLAMQSIGLNQDSSQQQAAIAKRGTVSSAVTRGAITSPGLRQGLSDISTQLANQLSGYDVQRGQENAQYGERKASLADQNATLDLQAKSLNMSRSQLQTELNRGLDRLGLSTALSVADITAKMNSSNIEDQMLAQQIFNAAIQNSDYYAQQYQPPASTHTSTPGGFGVGGGRKMT